MSNKKALGLNQGKAGRAGGALNTTNCLQYTTNCDSSQVSTLLDLAQYEADQALEQYRQAESLADRRRRAYFRALDNLHAIQQGVFCKGGRG